MKLEKVDSKVEAILGELILQAEYIKRNLILVNLASNDKIAKCDRLCENPPCTHLVVIRETPV